MQLLSIVTINFNHAEGLKKTIESVVCQTYAKIEYIIIDGGSTDSSIDVIKKHADKISYWISEKDFGVFDAQNKGLSKATGDYVLVLNSGDELQHNAIIEQVFNSYQVEDILYGNMTIVSEDGTKTKGLMPSNITFNHMMEDTLWHPVSFVKKSFLDKVGFYNLDFKIVADYDWFLNALFKHEAKLKYINQTISMFYLGGLSSQLKNIEIVKKERVKAQINTFGELKVQNYYLEQAKLRPYKGGLLKRIIKRLLK
jgi:glycosyltransferase involved in cell wall biosynthesis